MARLNGVGPHRVIVGLLAFVGVACGSAEDPAATIPRPPGTLRVPSPGETAAPVGSVVASEVSEPCPRSGGDSTFGSVAMEQSSRLEPMIGQVLQYGLQFPDEFGSHGLVWNGDDASVFVSFTGRLTEHRRALAEVVVAFPDELIVCQVAIPSAAGQALQTQLLEELEGRFLSMGQGINGFEVTLAPDEVELARELWERYGSAISLTVGALAYPPERAVSVCEPLPVGVEVPGLVVEVVAPAAPIVVSGTEPARLTAVARNAGSSPIRFTTGISRAALLDMSGRVVNAVVLAIPDIGFDLDLAPGESHDLEVVVTTASCDPALGYALPSGEYQLVAKVQHAAGEVATVLSPPIDVTIGS